MIYGIQDSKDVKLSNIERSLQEDITLIKTEDRSSRNLAGEDFMETLNREILRLVDEAAIRNVSLEVLKLELKDVPGSVAARDIRGFIKLIKNIKTGKLIGA
ncbi:MAG: hypothetical protein ABIY90_08315 [Puia sp.]